MIAEIEIVPSQVMLVGDATKPTSFVLEARLWTWLGTRRAGILESAGVPVSWSVSPSTAGLHLVGSPTGFHATVEMDPQPNLPATVTVRAQAGGIAAVSTIQATAASGKDLIKANYTDQLAPDVVVIRGERDPSDQPCAVWLPPALARTGMAGQATADCSDGDIRWGVALLDPAHAMSMYRQTWTSLDEVVDATTPAGIRSIPLAMRVFVGQGSMTAPELSNRQTAAQSYTVWEVNDANVVFKANRAGLALDVKDNQIISPLTGGAPTLVPDCVAGDNLTKAHDFLPSATSALLHVYLVDVAGGADGFTCPGTEDRPYPVIYLKAEHSGTVLLHEVGHALGLDVPGAGHADEMDGFDPGNVMVGGLADRDDVWRRRLTAGQVVRMNADSASWLNWAKDLAGTHLRDDSQPRLGCQCGGHDLPGRCPRLVDDVAKPRTSVGTLNDWDCSDVIRLPWSLGLGEEPLALVAGRRWRTPPGDCHRDFRGVRLSHDAADFIQVENLTRPGNCTSWVAIFFPNRGPIFSDLVGVFGGWSDAGDRFLPTAADFPDRPPVPVTVHLHYEKADEAQAKAGITDATEHVFGLQANRVGIALTVVPESLPPGVNLPATCPAAPANEFSACYSSADGVSVAQRVGMALGLPTLTAGELSEDAFKNNAFQPIGTRLTLGQVFRIHSFLTATLKTGNFPDCTPTPSPCPPLEAGGAP